MGMVDTTKMEMPLPDDSIPMMADGDLRQNGDGRHIQRGQRAPGQRRGDYSVPTGTARFLPPDTQARNSPGSFPNRGAASAPGKGASGVLPFRAALS